MGKIRDMSKVEIVVEYDGVVQQRYGVHGLVNNFSNEERGEWVANAIELAADTGVRPDDDPMVPLLRDNPR